MAAAQTKPTYDATTFLPKSEVMVVGVFHFSNSGSDLFNPGVADILGERRQREVADIVTALAKWRPTKICLEGDFRSHVYQEKYEGYLNGEAALSINERDQIGLRLAKTLGHHKVYPVDVPSGMDFDSVMTTAEKSGQSAKVAALMSEIETNLKAIFSPEAAEKRTLSQILAALNTKEMDEFSHSFYVRLLTVADGDLFPGADMLGEWTKRNLKIASNLFRLIDAPGERILLIIGSGHAKIIRDTLNQMPKVESIDPIPFLLGKR